MLQIPKAAGVSLCC